MIDRVIEFIHILIFSVFGFNKYVCVLRILVTEIVFELIYSVITALVCTFILMHDVNCMFGKRLT